jgi:hypothetical protein
LAFFAAARAARAAKLSAATWPLPALAVVLAMREAAGWFIGEGLAEGAFLAM